ncbi:hypothetical protein CPB85DRAFT_1253714 [Mucidula mucida]|nr:hypothetical protein CPB85DRAFT_1253714 [Mucidula mucida]
MTSYTFADFPRFYHNREHTVNDATASSLDLPTHLLACFSAPRARPYIIPVNVDRYRRVFRTEIISATQPIPSFTRTNQSITLPLVIPAITIPHPPSLAFLLLSNLSENDVAFQMLPPNVVGEFPNAAAMAQVMSFVGAKSSRGGWSGTGVCGEMSWD